MQGGLGLLLVLLKSNQFLTFLFQDFYLRLSFRQGGIECWKLKVADLSTFKHGEVSALGLHLLKRAFRNTQLRLESVLLLLNDGELEDQALDLVFGVPA
jgi:hypothetical protein